MDLVVEFLAIDRASPASSASRIAGLEHKVWNNAVEDDAIVVIALCEGQEVFAGLTATSESAWPDRPATGCDSDEAHLRSVIVVEL